MGFRIKWILGNNGHQEAFGFPKLTAVATVRKYQAIRKCNSYARCLRVLRNPGRESQRLPNRRRVRTHLEDFSERLPRRQLPARCQALSWSYSFSLTYSGVTVTGR